MRSSVRRLEMYSTHDSQSTIASHFLVFSPWRIWSGDSLALVRKRIISSSHNHERRWRRLYLRNLVAATAHRRCTVCQPLVPLILDRPARAFEEPSLRSSFLVGCHRRLAASPRSFVKPAWCEYLCSSILAFVLVYCVLPLWLLIIYWV